MSEASKVPTYTYPYASDRFNEFGRRVYPDTSDAIKRLVRGTLMDFDGFSKTKQFHHLLLAELQGSAELPEGTVRNIKEVLPNLVQTMMVVGRPRYLDLTNKDFYREFKQAAFYVVRPRTQLLAQKIMKLSRVGTDFPLRLRQFAPADARCAGLKVLPLREVVSYYDDGLVI